MSNFAGGLEPMPIEVIREALDLLRQQKYNEAEELISNTLSTLKNGSTYQLVVLLGHSAHRQRKYLSALSRFMAASQLAQTDEQRWESVLLSARSAFFLGYYDLALQLLSKFPKGHARYTDALWFRGVSNRLSENYAAALTALNELITILDLPEKKPQVIQTLKSALVQRGKTKLSIGDLKSAESDVAKAKELAPDDPEVVQFDAEVQRRVNTQFG